MPRDFDAAVRGYSKGKRRHKLWQRIVSSLICVVVFCTTYALILPAITMETAEATLLSEISGTSLNTAGKVEVTGGTAEYDPNSDSFSLSLRLDFTLSKTEIDNANGSFSYTLPDSVSIPDSKLGMELFGKDETGAVAFQYQFLKDTDGTYYIEIQFLDSYVTNMTGSSADVYIAFNSTVSKDAFTENGNLVIKDDDGTIVTIPAENVDFPDNETVNYDLSTSKTGVYDKFTGLITYTIKVKSYDGTPDPITLTDIMAATGATVSGISNLTVNKTVVDSNWQSSTSVVADYTSSYSNGTLNLTLPGLTETTEGYQYQEYTITYTVDASGLEAGASAQYNNNVTVTSTDPTTGETVKGTGTSYVTVSNSVLKKTGAFDAASGTITWTITVNADGNNIAGYVLSDNMLSQANGTIQIQNANGSTVSNGETTNANGSITFNAVTDSNGDGTADSNTNTYIITYTTTQNQTTSDTKVDNDAVLTPPSGSSEEPVKGGTSVYVPAGGGINKVSDGSVNNTDGLDTLNWKTTVTVPDGGITNGTVITDYIGSNSYGTASNHWFTAAQINALYNNLNSTLPSGSFKLEYTNNVYGSWSTYSGSLSESDTTKYYAYRVTFLSDVGYDKFTNGSFEIAYSTTADFSTVTDYESYQNFVWMNSTSNNSKADTTHHAPVVKMDGNGNTWDTYTTNEDGTVSWYVKVYLEKAKTGLEIIDTLPSGVTLKKIGFGLDYRANAHSDAAAFSTSDSLTINGTEHEITNSQSGQTVTSSIAGTIPAGTTIYVYYECQIDDAANVGYGESKTYSGLTNNVVVTDLGSDSQTQTVTVNKPVLVTKTDGNGNSSDTSYESTDGVVEWFVKVYLKENATSIKVTDTLPSGVTLTQVGASTTSGGAKTSADADGGTGESGWTVSNSTSGNVATTTISATSAIPAGTTVYVYYKCQITNFTANTTYELNNSATVQVGGNDYGTDDQKQTVTGKVPDAEVVSKNSYWNGNTKQIEYSVIINAGAEDLDGDSDTLTVVDVMKHYRSPSWSINSKLVNSSVKLYYMNADGTKGAEVPASEWSWVFSDNVTPELLAQNWAQIENTITATVPDSTALILEYTYDIGYGQESTNQWGTNFDVENTVTIYGDNTSTDKESGKNFWEVTGSSAGIRTDHVYMFTKVEKGNYGNTLPGAVFAVYIYNENGTDERLSSNGSYVTYTSGENGMFTVSWDDGWFREDVVYYVRELHAPDGYAADTSARYYFYFGSTNSTVEPPSGAINLSNAYGNAYVENAKNATSVSVTKKWDDAVGVSDRKDVTVQLFQVYTAALSEENILLLADDDTETQSGASFSYQFVDSYDPSDSLSGSASKALNTQVTLVITDLYGDKNAPSVKLNTVPLTASQTTGTYQNYGNTYTSKIYTYVFNLTNSTNELIASLTGKVANDPNYPDWAFDITYGGTDDSGSSGGDSGDSGGSTETPVVGTLPTGGTLYETVVLNSSNNWTYEWSSLPLYEVDASGHITGYYSYYAVETTTGYTTTYSTYETVTEGEIIITNAPLETEDVTSVTVTKVWKDSNGNTITEPPVSSVTVKLYHTNTDNEKTLHGTYVLTAENNWTLTLENLHTKDSDKKALTYSVEEVAVDGYTTSYTSSDNSFTVTNTKDPTIKLTVTKDWYGGTPPTDSVTVDIYRNGELHHSETLTAANNWTTTVELPKSDGKTDYTYYIVESGVDGYRAYYSNGTVSGKTSGSDVTVSGSDGSITVTNKPVTDIGVVKAWASGTAQKDVEVKLWRISSSSATAPTDWSTEGLEPYSTVTLGSEQADGWDKTWKNLPLYDYDATSNTYTYYYYFVEETTTGYTTTYSVDGLITGGTVTITNSPAASDTTDITVNKEWITSAGVSAQFQLYQEYHEYPMAYLIYYDGDWSVGTENAVSTRVTGAGTYTLSWDVSSKADGLMRFNITIPDAYDLYKDYSISVKSIKIDGQEIGLTADRVKLYAVWADSGQKDSNGNSIWYQTNDLRLEIYDAYGETKDNSPISTSLTVNQNVTVEFTLTEPSEAAGAKVECNSWWSAFSDSIPLTTEGVKITFTNTSFDDDRGEFSNWYGPLWVLFSGDGTVSSEDYSEYWVQRLDNWGWTVASGAYGVDLQSNSDNLNGYGISYVGSWEATDFQGALKEGAEVTIFAYLDYAGNAVIRMSGAGVTSTVTLPVDTSETVYLAIGGDHTTLTDLYITELTKSISGSGTAYGTAVSIGESDGWKHTWTNLQKYAYDSNGNIVGYYTYYVVETASGYTVFYDNSSGITSGTVTVTNAEGEHYELPQTGGSGTILYTLGGGVLIALAAVLQYNHKKGRKGAHSP